MHNIHLLEWQQIKKEKRGRRRGRREGGGREKKGRKEGKVRERWDNKGDFASQGKIKSYAALL